MLNIKRKKGFTILELSVVIVIFGMFLIAIYTILDAGLKGWNLGKNRTEIQNSGELLIRRLVRDITMGSKDSMVIDPNGTYICMETPMLNGEYTYDPNEAGLPYWHGHVLYYLYLNGDGKNTIYRNYISHPRRRTPVPLGYLSTYMTPPSTPSATHRPFASDVDKFEIKLVASLTHPVVNIKIIYRKTPGKYDPNSSGRFSISGTSEGKGVEIFELQASAEPKN